MVAAIALIALVVRWAPTWLAPTRGLSRSERAAEIGRVRTSVLAVLAGGIAIVGAIYTARTFALNQQGQITERFSRAIEHLGHKEMDVRIGGIYALERIARESAVDHAPIMEVLTAYLREHSPRLSDETVRGGEPDDTPEGRAQIATDVQAAASVVARRRSEQDGSLRLNLRGVDLRGVDLSGVHLTAANLAGTNLSGAVLDRAVLVGVNLTGADLSGAVLDAANLIGAFLVDADLTEAALFYADLSRASLHNANLSKTALLSARLSAAGLIQADLSGANLIDADLRGAYLVEANLRETLLFDADLGGADLSGAKLIAADLSGADLSGAAYSDRTIWPDDFDPARHGAQLIGLDEPDATEMEASSAPAGVEPAALGRTEGEVCGCRT